MTELNRLPPDQRAVLSLVLDRGKSYGEVAEMLAIPESTVRDRAHAALDALANDPTRPGASRPPAPPRTGGAGTGETGTGRAGVGETDASRVAAGTRSASQAPASGTGRSE